jgi:outer membrane protein assembly factor BamA
MTYKLLTALTFISLIFSSQSVAQEEPGSQVEEKHTTQAFLDFFTFYLNKEKAKNNPDVYPAKMVVAPIISFSPITNLAFGAGIKNLFKMRGSGDETRTSNMPISLMYTLNNQFLVTSGFEVFFPQEKWMLIGNIGYLDFARYYYGQGDTSPQDAEQGYDYKQLVIEPVLAKQAFTRYLFLGGGIRYNQVSDVVVNEEGEGAGGDPAILPADKDDFRAVGVEAAAIYDSRDNILNGHRGWFARIRHGVYNDALGSTHNFQATNLDLRHYIMLSDKRRDVFAFQIVGKFTTEDTPIFEQGQLGGHELLRGYYDGRYIDRNMYAIQTEYRFQVKGRIGAVVFAGFGETAETLGSFNFKNVLPSVGAGIRFLFNKEEDLNVRLDYGFGRESNEFYLQIAEAF